MKKKTASSKELIKIFVGFAVSIALLITALIFVGCGAPAYERLADNISELRENIFEGANENFELSIISGLREEPFMLDGIAGTTREFTLATLIPLSEISGVVKVKAIIDGTTFNGEFTKHPFAQTLSVEFATRATGSEIILTIFYNDYEQNISAKSVLTENMIGYQKALEIAENKLRNSLEVFREGSVLRCEIFIRLIPNQIDNVGGFHWYVAFIGSEQQIFAALIDPITMQVVATRT